MGAVQVRLPAEWENQSAVQLTWPHADTDWAGSLEETENTYIEIALHISYKQFIFIVFRHEIKAQSIIQQLIDKGANSDNLLIGIAPSNDTWARDFGALAILQNEKPRLLDFQFNGWGGKYPAELDNTISRTLADSGVFGETPLESVRFVLEGGAVETDGQGTLLATRSSVITESRNSGMTQSAIEQLLADKLGIERFLWLNNGHLSGDDTDGHIDTLARFVDPKTIVYATAHSHDPDYPALEAMQQELATFRRADGSPYKLVPLPPISPTIDSEGRRLPASYANFLIINGAVLLPIYGDSSDQRAIDCLADCFPEREIIPVDCRTLIRQNGSLHCITMQFPAGITFSKSPLHP